MAAEAIKIRATAAKLYKETGDSSIEGYKTMPLDDLKTHIERIQKGGSAAPAKGKTASANGAARPKGKATPAASPAKGKGKPAATAPKGKGSASTSAPAKSKTQKSSPAKGKAATGTAKRPTAAAAKGKASTAKGKTTPAKGRMTAKPAAKGKTTTTKAPAKTRGKAQPTGRVDIDNKAVDWKADWNGGKTGKRGDVMSALRKFKGDKAKVFVQLQPNARTYYKGRPKHEAERMLVWLIGRVAFDFVTATGQHEMGTRAEYGTASDTKNVRRRELREQRRKEQEKVARAAKRAASTGTGAKGKTAPARKPAARGKAATTAKGKGK